MQAARVVLQHTLRSDAFLRNVAVPLGTQVLQQQVEVHVAGDFCRWKDSRE